MKHFFIIAVIALFSLASCKDKNSSEIDYNPNVLSSKDYIRGEDAILEVMNAFFKGVNDSLVKKSGYGYIDKCDVTYLANQNSLLFGYGAENRECEDGKMRKGNFIAIFTGDIFLPGTIAHIITDSLFVDDCLIRIDMRIEHSGLNGENKEEYLLMVDSSNIVLPDTTKLFGVEIATNFAMVWETGASTPPIHEDDMFRISGTASGISSNGYAFTVTVEEPLENWLDCFWISRGNNRITVPSAQYPTGNIDYISADSCNNQFDFYFNGNRFYDQIK